MISNLAVVNFMQLLVYVKGTRQKKVKQRQFISTYLYGAACHKTGQSYAIVLPYGDCCKRAIKGDNIMEMK